MADRHVRPPVLKPSFPWTGILREWRYGRRTPELEACRLAKSVLFRRRMLLSDAQPQEKAAAGALNGKPAAIGLDVQSTFFRA